MTSRKQLTNNTNKLDNNKDEVVRFKTRTIHTHREKDLQTSLQQNTKNNNARARSVKNALYSGITHILLSVIAL